MPRSSSSASSACRTTASTTATWRPKPSDVGEYEKNLEHMVALAKERQQATGIKLLWGTANLFSTSALHARRRHQSATPTCSPTRRRR